MRIVFYIVTCLSLVGLQASQENERRVEDWDEYLLLDDGSIWECFDKECIRGDLVTIQGEYVKDSPVKTCRVMEMDGEETVVELVGWLEEETKIKQVAEYFVKTFTSEGVKNAYGYLTYLDNGMVLLVGNLEPHPMVPGQVVYKGNLGTSLCCLVDKESRMFLNNGICIASSDALVTRTVQEVTDEAYIFDDGFVLPRVLSLPKEPVCVEIDDVQCSFHIDSVEPVRCSFAIGRGEDFVKGFFEVKKDLFVRLDINWDDEIDFLEFVGSESFVKNLSPGDLQVGDVVSGYRFCMKDQEVFSFFSK